MSNRFDSYLTSLRNTLTQSKSALTNKGVSVSSSTKLSNVPTLIGQIKTGYSGVSTITITCNHSKFIGKTITAKHTSNTTVTKTVDSSLKAVLEISKDGAWTVTNSLTNEKLTFNINTQGSFIYDDNSYITIDVTLKSKIFSSFQDLLDRDESLGYGDVTLRPVIFYKGNSPDGTAINTYEGKFTEFPNLNSTHTSKTFTVNGLGYYNVHFSRPTHGQAYKTINITQVGQRETVYFTMYAVNKNTLDITPQNDSELEQPSVNGENPKTEVPIFFIIDSSNMSNEQVDEIYDQVNELVKQGKTDDEINEYIKSMEAKYGQI